MCFLYQITLEELICFDELIHSDDSYELIVQ